ncbi:unnamed protein product [Didymodactylos carnosus]|uniref:Uncharacterized protein n=2 Tax=Didymodactylos carnosus TaxID=1234261 RepID=A0A8S2DZN8_9BILA|nr:unnamed protein product [Didymodactylos carnosus]CAF3793884.1 unnamed protein product [Didymodactylos carnosus]
MPCLFWPSSVHLHASPSMDLTNPFLQVSESRQSLSSSTWSVYNENVISPPPPPLSQNYFEKLPWRSDQNINQNPNSPKFAIIKNMIARTATNNHQQQHLKFGGSIGNLFGLTTTTTTTAMVRKRKICSFCKSNGESSSVYTSHNLRDAANNIECPVLMAYTCPKCGASGNKAHTIKYCTSLSENERVSLPTVKLFKEGRCAAACPPNYNDILNGCYKVNNVSNITWNNARNMCVNDSNSLTSNFTGKTHLLSLESATESTSLMYWLKGWNIQDSFWIDGFASNQTWTWSDQKITWYFNISEQMFNGNGSNYRIFYNQVQNEYNIMDDIEVKQTHYICEYQGQLVCCLWKKTDRNKNISFFLAYCNGNNSCQNNATCFMNAGRELCICAGGFTGSTCTQEIDECLSSPCLHGGICTDQINDYYCNCSMLFYNGTNSIDDALQGQRRAAFLAVLGVVVGLVGILTLSDLPWSDIARYFRCPWISCRCISGNSGDVDEDDEISMNGENEQQTTAQIQKLKNTNYHVMDTVWNPDSLVEINHDEIVEARASVLQSRYNGYISPPPRAETRISNNVTSPDNQLIKSFAAIVAKQQEKKNKISQIYAVDLPATHSIETPITTKIGDKTISTPSKIITPWTVQLQQELRNKKKPEQLQQLSGDNRPGSNTSTVESISKTQNNISDA